MTRSHFHLQHPTEPGRITFKRFGRSDRVDIVGRSYGRREHLTKAEARAEWKRLTERGWMAC